MQQVTITQRPLPGAVDVPELQSLTEGQHDLVLYAVTVAGFALLASFLHAVTTRDEVSARYRPAVIAHLCITGVAALSYVILVIEVHLGYDLRGETWVPTQEALSTIAPRYLDWSVTVPLLMVELLAVCTLVGRRLRWTRFVTAAAAFLMIITGYLGNQVFEDGTSEFWMWFWFVVSSAFGAVLYVVLIPVAFRSARELPHEAGKQLRRATVLLFTVFLVYPIVYLIPIFAAGPWWTTTIHLSFSAADVVAKIGFGLLIHEVAKLRTAHDVRTGVDTHPEPVWVVHEHHSGGVQPVRQAEVEPQE